MKQSSYAEARRRETVFGRKARRSITELGGQRRRIEKEERNSGGKKCKIQKDK